MPFRLKDTLVHLGKSQREMGDAIGLSSPSISQLLNKGEFPKDQEGVKGRIAATLERWGVPAETLAAIWDWDGEGVPAAQNRAPRSERQCVDLKEDEPMFMRNQRVHLVALKHFRIRRDPFTGDLQSEDDVLLSNEPRYLLEEMTLAASSGGFLAIVGESGSGKTTLRLAFEEQAANASAPAIRLIYPSMLGAGLDSHRGYTLQAGAIIEAVISTLSEKKPPRTLQAKTALMERLLREGHAAGTRYAVVIDEAHDLSIATLKHLKRFNEVRRGIARLLGVILLGQPELKMRLDERRMEVREVVQRASVVELAPLSLPEVVEYVAFKIRRAGGSPEIIDPDAFPEVVRLLGGGLGKTNRLYPLAVGNLVAASLNIAASISAPRLTGEHVREALREAR